jgi:hypothetical protein
MFLLLCELNIDEVKFYQLFTIISSGMYYNRFQMPFYFDS